LPPPSLTPRRHPSSVPTGRPDERGSHKFCILVRLPTALGEEERSILEEVRAISQGGVGEGRGRGEDRLGSMSTGAQLWGDL
jgi:hypothetical protein